MAKNQKRFNNFKQTSDSVSLNYRITPQCQVDKTVGK